jgi:hypothetical protein
VISYYSYVEFRYRRPAASQGKLRVAKEVHQRLAVPSITTGIGRKNMSRNLRGGKNY